MATPTTLPATFVAGNVLTAAQMNNLRGAFRIFQVAQTVKTDTFSTTSTTYTDLTGLSVSITPSATSSKILVVANTAMALSNNSIVTAQLVRDSTAIYLGDAAGTRIRASYGTQLTPADQLLQGTMIFLDSPNTTSATTYKVQVRTAGNTLYVNRTSTDTDSTLYMRSASSITVMEVSA